MKDKILLDKLLDFVKKHWILSSVILIAIVGILITLINLWCSYGDVSYDFYDINLDNSKNIENKKLHLSMIKDKSEFIFKILTGIITIFVFGATVWRLKIADDNKKIADENHKLAKKQEINERYAKAIELLGDKSEAVRIGALYTLEQLSKENGEYFDICLEAIAGYVRHESNYGEKMITFRDKFDKWLKEKNSYYEAKMYYEDTNQLDINGEPMGLYKPRMPKNYLPEDIITAVNILSRSKAGTKHNLKNIDWSNIDLSTTSIEFKNIDFSDSIFVSTKFSPDINLSTCCFRRSNLKKASLIRAKLEGVNLRWARLKEADLRGANLESTIFRHANLIEANLSKAKLKHTKFRFADLVRVNLINSELIETELEAELTQAYLDKQTFFKFKDNFKGWSFNDKDKELHFSNGCTLTLEKHIGYLTKAPKQQEAKKDDNSSYRKNYHQE